jgi:hypothetical protein
MGHYPALVLLTYVDESYTDDAARPFQLREGGTAGYRHRKLTRIVDTLHFAPISASRLVQDTDMITFLYRRVCTHRETDPRSPNAKIAMWGRLRPRVHHGLCWFPSLTAGQQQLWGQDLPWMHEGPA